MRLDEKARENLEAAERLLPDEHERPGLFNAAASRAYYAAYLAVADRALRAGCKFTDRNGTYYRHDRLSNDARGWGILDEEAADALFHLHGLRIKADYAEDQIDVEEATVAYNEATRLVTGLLGEAT